MAKTALQMMHPKDLTPDQLWEAYGKWAMKVCHKMFMKYRRMVGEPKALWGVAFEALVRCARIYDPAKGEFTTYSHRAMVTNLTRFITTRLHHNIGKTYQQDGEDVTPVVMRHGDFNARRMSKRATSGDGEEMEQDSIAETAFRSSFEALRYGRMDEYNMNPEQAVSTYQGLAQALNLLNNGGPSEARNVAFMVILFGLESSELCAAHGFTRQNEDNYFRQMRKDMDENFPRREKKAA